MASKLVITICMLANYLRFYFCLLTFFQKLQFQKNISKILSVCQTAWAKITHNILLGLIKVQTICNNNQYLDCGSGCREREREREREIEIEGGCSDMTKL